MSASDDTKANTDPVVFDNVTGLLQYFFGGVGEVFLLSDENSQMFATP